ncbi:hypothetical protein SUGI_0525620 [Cryptomeria japonica]|nr:hypothetical protein SUGI_0525620 [Cryptomeria japonica]
MEPKLYCVSIPSSGLPLHVPVEWLIRALVLCSMLLQVFLVFGGGYRYRRSSHVLRFVVWLAYMSADVVAISGLGIMIHSAKNQMYGVWAPLLLLHLGGPDNITAYSTADNELWIRHGLIMIYQVSVAAYVVYLSSLKGYMLASAILLFIAGATKYGERTAALRYATYSQIVSSTQPVYKFMQHEDEIEREINMVDYNYLVMGEDQFQRNLKEKQRQEAKPQEYAKQQQGVKPQEDAKQQQDTNQRKETRISSSNEQEVAGRRSYKWNSLLKGGEIVTIKNVWYQEGLQTTDNYIPCLSHALFKMYKRRFVSLYFHEGIRPKTRKFFINERLPCEKLFKIVEMELKFMYDVLFSKSSGTAFGKRGTLMRLLNTTLLVVAGILLYTGENVETAQKTVTYVVISVAIAMEIIQLCRIAVSDWTMVRLRRPNCSRPFTLKFVRLAISVLGNVRKACGNKYWKESITQYSVIDACSSKWSFIWDWFQCDFIVPLFIKVFHMKGQPVEADFKRFIFQKLKAACSPDQEVATCRERVYGYDEWLATMDCKDLQWASNLDMEDLILTWHIATTICERHHTSGARTAATNSSGDGATTPPPAASPAAAPPAPGGDGTTSASSTTAPVGGAATDGGAGGCGGVIQNISCLLSRYCAYLPTIWGAAPAAEAKNNEEHIRFSSLLSRYCAYLLVSHPNILPLHADIAKLSYIELHYELVPLLKKGQPELKDYGNTTTLGFGTKLTRQLLDRPQEDRWEVLSGFWAGLVIYMAVYNKASLHAECLACGGEFLSQVWVLLGHMGCGEQSDTAVTKNKEAKSKREIEEEQKKRRREEETSKESEKNRRREEQKNAREEERLKARKEEELNLRREEEKKKKTREKHRRILQSHPHSR